MIQPLQFEHPIAEKIFQSNLDLNENIRQQTESLISLHTSFDFIDWSGLDFTEKKRLEAIQCWCTTLLENINAFNLYQIKARINDLSIIKVQTVDNQKKELDKLTRFIIDDMEVPDFKQCEWSQENESERSDKVHDEAGE